MSNWHNTWKGLGRNDPCWCGRDKKYKHCHLPIEGQDESGNIERAEAKLSVVQFGHAHLYKYTNLSNLDWLKEILVDNRIYCPLPCQLNDPFECRTYSDLSATFEEKRRYYFNKVKIQLNTSDNEACRLTDQWLETGEYEDPAFWEEEERLLLDAAYTSDFRLFCLTPHPANLLMWSRYGDKHKGVALRFRTDGGFDRAWKVHYASQYPNVSFSFGSSRFDQMKALVLTKSADWSYEDEFRLFRVKDRIRKEPFPTHFLFRPDLLDGVILGSELEADKEKEILEMVKLRTASTEILRATRSSREYSLDITRVDQS